MLTLPKFLSVMGIGDSRRTRALLTSCANFLSRLLSFATFILISRIALADLGEVRFGIWMTISSLLLLMSFLDLGVGNGLVSPVARANAAGDREEVAAIVTRGLAITAAIGAVVIVTTVAVSAVAPIGILFPGVSKATLVEARTALTCMAVLIGLSLPLGAIGRIFLGMQRGYVPHVASIVGALATMALIAALGGRGGLSVTDYILITFGLVQLSALVVAVFLAADGYIRPAILASSRPADYLSLLMTGGLFFGLQITAMLAWGLDQSLISAMRGPAAVAGFAVTARIFMLVSQPLVIWNAPLWSAYADAISQGDRAFVRRTFRRSLLITGALAIAGILSILAVGRSIWDFFTDGRIAYDHLLMLSFGAWAFCEAIGGALAMYFNGAHIVREQLITMTIFLAIVIPAKLVAIQIYGAAPVPLVTAICYLLTLGLMYGIVFRQALSAPMR
jgi:O-antigen/teichoic acid export membrane protein